MITCREKLELEHPEYVNEKWHGGCKDCPHTYGYTEKDKCKCDSKTCTDELCGQCWNQPYEGELTKQEKIIRNIKAQANYWKDSYERACNDASDLRMKLVGIEDHVEKKTGNWNNSWNSTDSYIKSEFDKLFLSRNIWRAAFIGMLIGNIIALILQSL